MKIEDVKLEHYQPYRIAGGQQVLETSCGVRATHVPTGLSAICDEERSQIKNREKAIAMLAHLVDEATTKVKETYDAG